MAFLPVYVINNSHGTKQSLGNSLQLPRDDPARKVRDDPAKKAELKVGDLELESG